MLPAQLLRPGRSRRQAGSTWRQFGPSLNGKPYLWRRLRRRAYVTIKTFERSVDCGSRHSTYPGGGILMKYMLLVYATETVLTPEERDDCYVKSAQLARDIHLSGNYLAASPLHL